MSDHSKPTAGRPANEAITAVGWFVLAVAARAPFVARIEGTLDHDQSVVGLMALDIARGKRFPIFFDGQRYMGAVEAYVAAAFVRAFGHSPEVVAMAPLLAFGLFAAGQFVVWSRWRDRATGHLAAGLSVLGSPMLVLWGIVPRGGYVEFLAWGLPTLAIYRVLTEPGRAKPGAAVQAGWGFMLALGFFLNPLSLTVYVTLAIDWTLGRHGADLRRERNLRAAWLDHPVAPVALIVFATVWVAALAFCCHVDPVPAEQDMLYVGFVGWLGKRWGVFFGAAGVLGLLAVSAWWMRGPARLFECVMRVPWSLAGVIAASAPIVAYNVLVRLGVYPPALSLPIWITAPWKTGPNARVLLGALGTLIGCDPRASQTVLIGSGVEPPSARWPMVEMGLMVFSPQVIAVVLMLVAVAAWRDRPCWSRLFALRGEAAATPVALASGYLAVTVGLYLLQGSSPNPSSIRYLVPVWVALPGLLACGLRTLPKNSAVLAGLMIAVPWLGAQTQIWCDIDRPSPMRPLADELARRGVNAVVAQTQVALIVANLTHGAVGAVEYQPGWSRIGERYRDRFRADGPLTCVVDRRFPWGVDGEGAWREEEDFGRHLRALSVKHPGKVKACWRVGSFEVWEVDLPLADVLAAEPVGSMEDQSLAVSGR